MLDPREQKWRLRRVVALSGMTGFALVTLLMMFMVPAAHDANESRHRWQFIAQVAIAGGLLTMSLTYFLLRRQR